MNELAPTAPSGMRTPSVGLPGGHWKGPTTLTRGRGPVANDYVPVGSLSSASRQSPGMRRLFRLSSADLRLKNWIPIFGITDLDMRIERDSVTWALTVISHEHDPGVLTSMIHPHEATPNAR